MKRSALNAFMTIQRKGHLGSYKAGYHINGIDLFADIRQFLLKEEFKVVFDVGANIGQSTEQMACAFPVAQIYSFEPIFDSFMKLKHAVAALPNVNIYNIGLSSCIGQAAFASPGRSTRFRVSADGIGVMAQLETVDHFCQSHAVGEICLLKIDTEGHDLDVLKGAQQMLSSGLVNMVLAECSMNPANDSHVPFSEIYEHLTKFGFALFGFYEQVREWPTREPHLRRCNVCFISQKVIMRNRYNVR
jgi:FkbM family methyltransferase